jgi:RHH-type proline utilization regulon transcriptional repressor/proline dehydrogenase/delta 1-pyrroline-5-carboxylate dehydrogenase
VLTSRAATDMNYLACARLLLQKRKLVYPMFGTHNALTLACILSYARRSDDTPDAPYDFECQRLHGMGEALWQAVRRQPRFAHLPCRIYTPVGNDASALAYLIRRLLENGANSSFVHQAQDPGTPVDTLLKDPLEICKQRMFAPAERLPDPPWLHAPRKNAASFHLHNRDVQRWAGNTDAKRTDLLDKQRLQSDRLLEKTRAAGTASAPCMQTAQQALRQSAPLSVETRARQLEAWADAIETRADEALCLLVAQARKTAPDALAEIRETIDYLRYYAQQARLQLATPRQLTGPAGETNTLQLAPRGVWLCISPWNFPLAIFTGQIAAALVCGNAVLAKPAEQTSLIATWCVSLAHETGISEHRLQLLPAQRQAMPAYLQAPGLAGVSFTGSNATARQIRQTLAQRDGPQVSLIAETGGMNAMVVDSTALLEQTADHIMLSAFNMAGQRCSALRVLYVQADIAEALMVRLQGMAELIKTGSPSDLDCDVPPLIDQDALARLKQQWHSLTQEGEVIVQPVFRGDASDTESADSTQTSHLPVCTPGIIRMQTPRVEQEIFGPVLQVCVFAAHEFERVLDDIASWGWGLTFGLQSRIDSRAADVSRLPVGNVYINRPMIGATVGVQPFGGQGLSGSGPKAGGPDSLGPYCTEQLVSINSAAAGGAMELLTMAADPVKLANRFDH